MESLVINRDNMIKNVNLYGGTVFSQKVLLKLVELGYTREDAYRIVQKHALNALNGGDFKKNLLSNKSVSERLDEKDIEDCFNIEDYLKNINKVFEKFKS